MFTCMYKDLRYRTLCIHGMALIESKYVYTYIPIYKVIQFLKYMDTVFTNFTHSIIKCFHGL